MTDIEQYHPDHLHGIQKLVNHHISAVIPGWTLPAAYIEQHLYRNPHQLIIDPWVDERITFVALENQRVVAVVHLLHYSAGEDVGQDYRGACDVAWLLAWNEHLEAGSALLNTAHEQANGWNAPRIFAWDSHLPTPMIFGIPDVWGHLIDLFTQAGYEPMPHRKEALYGGWLHQISAPADLPIAGLVLRRTVRSMWGVGFTAWINDEQVGFCECVSDLTEGGAVPNLRGWAELGEIFIEEAWRGRGIGTWLIQHAVQWLRLAGCDRIVLSCEAEDEAAGAGRFYNRLGWEVFTRLQDGWHLK